MKTSAKNNTYTLITRKAASILVIFMMLLSCSMTPIGGVLGTTNKVYADSTQTGDTDAKQRCDDILAGRLPSGYHYAKDTDDYSPKMGIVGNPGNAAVVGGAAKSNSTNGSVTDSDSNTFSSVLPFGTIYIDSTALTADNRVLKITDKNNFVRNAESGTTYNLQRVNTNTKDHKLDYVDTILYTGGIASTGTEQVIGDGTDELFSLTYPNAAVLHDETRGDLVLSFKKVTFISNQVVGKFGQDSEGNYSGLPISIAADNNLSIVWAYLNPKTGFPLSKTAHFGRTIKQLKDPTSGSEVTNYSKEGYTYTVNTDSYVDVTQSGTKIGTYYFEWKYGNSGDPEFVKANWVKESSYTGTAPAAPSFDESESYFGGLGYYTYNATSKQYTRIGAETLRVGAEYIVEYKVVKDGAEQEGSFLYAVNDLDVKDHNVYGKTDGDYSEGLEIVNGALSYAVVPEYKNSANNTEHSIGTGTTLNGSQTPLFIDATNHESSDNFANGIRFASANLTDENTFDTGFAVVLNAKGTMRWTGSSAINMGTKLFDTTNYWHIEQTATNGIIYAETYDLENNCAAKQHTGEITAGTGDTVHHASKANDGYHLEEIIIDGQSVPPSVIASIKNSGTETTWTNPNDGQVYKFTYDTNGVLRVAFEDIHANHKIHVGYEPDDQYRYVQKQWVGGEASDRKSITLIAQAYRQTPVYYASAKDGWRTSNNSPKGPGGTDTGFPAKKLADPNGDGVVYLIRAEYYPTDIGITRTIMSSDTDTNKLQWTWDGRSLWYISDTFLNTTATRTTVDNSSLAGTQDDKDNSIDVLPAWSGAELDKDSSVQDVINEFLNTQGSGKGKTVNFNAWIRILGGNNGAYNVQKVKDDNYMGTYLPTIQAAALLPVDGYDAKAALGSGTASSSGYTVKLTIPVDSDGAPVSRHVTAEGNTWTIAWPVFGDSSDGSLAWPALPKKDAAGNDLYWFVTEETPEDWDTVRYKNGGDMPIANYGISGQNAQASMLGKLNLRDGVVADSVNPNILGGYGNTTNTAKSPGHTSHAYLGDDVDGTYKNAGTIANQQLTDVTFTKQWYDTVTSHTKDTLLTELGDKLHLMAEVDGVGKVDVTEFYLDTASKASRKYTDTDGTIQKDYITVTDGTGSKAFDIKFKHLPTYWFGDKAPGYDGESKIDSSNYTQLVETDNKWTNYGFNTDWNRTKNVTVDLSKPHKITRYYLTEDALDGYIPAVYDNSKSTDTDKASSTDGAYSKMGESTQNKYGKILNIQAAQVKAIKAWNDADNQDQLRTDVIFKLTAKSGAGDEGAAKNADGTEAANITISGTATSEVDRTAIWGDKLAADKSTENTSDVLPAFDKDGNKITYFAEEVTVPEKYTVDKKKKDTATSGDFTETITDGQPITYNTTITNKHDPEPGKVDGDETYGLKGQSQTGTPNYAKNPNNPVTPTSLIKPDKEGATISTDGKTVTIPGEGTYKLNDDGTITFTPDTDFVGDPTPVQVKGKDKQGNELTAMYTPHVKDNTETHTVSRTITYLYDDDDSEVNNGSGSSTKVTQTVTFTRTITAIDPKTGKVTATGEWTPSSDTMPEVTSPTADRDGFVPGQDKVDALTVSPDDTPEDITIYYHKPPKANEKKTYGGVDEIQKGKPDFTKGSQPFTEFKLVKPDKEGAKVSEDGTTVTVPGEGTYTVDTKTGEVTFKPELGYTGTATTVTVRGYTGHMDKPYRLTDSSGNPTEETSVPALDKDGNTVGTYTIDPKTGKLTYTPTDPVNPGTPVEPNVIDPVYESVDGYYTPTIVKNTRTQTVKRTIEYKYDDGTPVLDEKGNPKTVVEELTFTQTGNVDPETGTVNWPKNWEPQSYDEVPSDAIPGYTPNKKVVTSESTTPNDGDKTVTVVYKRDTYTVTYVDGDHGESDGKGDQSGEHYGDKVTGGNSVKADKGYKFTGRYTYVITDNEGNPVLDKNGNPVQGETDDPKSIPITGNIVFTPIYEKLPFYNINYDPNGGSGSMDDDNYSSDESSMPDKNNTFTRKGYRFTGFYAYITNGATGKEELITDASGKPILFSNAQDMSEYFKDMPDGTSIRMEAQWKPNKYTIKYDANGGSGTMTSQNFTGADSEATSNKNKFTRKGYAFNGFKAKDKDGNYLKDKNGKDLVFKDPSDFIKYLHEQGDGGEITLVAQWRKLPTVIYVDPATGRTIQKTLQFIDENTEPDAPADPTRKGYKFTGWKRVVEYDDEGNIVNIRYEAQWEVLGDYVDPPTRTDEEEEPDTTEQNPKSNVDTGDRSIPLTAIASVLVIAAIIIVEILVRRYRKSLK